MAAEAASWCKKVLLPANEGTLELSRPPALILGNGVGSPGHLGRSQSHF